MERLQQLIEEGVIDEVFNQLKTGKEAEVWLVSHRGEPVAAKIYKAREFRSFKNDAGYKEGRVVRNTRTQRAMDKGSRFGREAAEEAWKQAEADALFTLHAAGVRVPRPTLFYEGVLLMEVIGDAEGRVAPRLVDAHIPREQAEPLYRELRAEIIKMLAADLIHGDLSEFNVLLGANGPVIIDFPQVVTAAKNSRSEPYFRRDLGNMLRFFSSIDPGVSRHASDADEIWREYVRRDLSPHFVPSGRAHPGQHRQHGGRGPHHRRDPQGQSGGAQGMQGQHGAGAQPSQRGAQGMQGQQDQRGAGGQPGQRGGAQGMQGQRGAGGQPGQRGGGQGMQGQPDQRGAGGQPGQRGGAQGMQGQQRGAGGQQRGGTQGIHGQHGAGGPQGQPGQRGGARGMRGPRGAGGPQAQQGQRGGGQAMQGAGGGGAQGQTVGPGGNPPGGPPRRGPEVVYRGAPRGDGGQPRGGGVERRRPRRRF